jgi:ribokinase
MQHIVVFGSINMDLVVRSAHIPVPGETILGSDFVAVPGGKGANQAVAAAKLGTPTRLVGAVGDDAFAAPLQQSLQTYGVDTKHVMSTNGASGVALITVADNGENSIVVASGANMQLDHTCLDAVAEALDGADTLLLQLEIPLELVIAAAQMARRRGVRVILDPAPARSLPGELLNNVDIVTPNESETAILTGIFPNDEASCQAAYQSLRAQGASAVIIKRGAHGAWWSNGQSHVHVPAFSVPAIDTVAAGDCYNGALAVALRERMPLATAMRFAAASAALSVTRRGAQQSMPTRPEVERLLAEINH